MRNRHLAGIFDVTFATKTTPLLIRGLYRLILALTANTVGAGLILLYWLPFVGIVLKVAASVCLAIAACAWLVGARVALEYLIVIFDIDRKVSQIAERITPRKETRNDDKS